MAAQNKTPQNLSPDLQQIYDRVMNTPSKKDPGNNQSTQAPNPQQGGSSMPSVEQAGQNNQQQTPQQQQQQMPQQQQPGTQAQAPQPQTPQNNAASQNNPQPAMPNAANSPEQPQQNQQQQNQDAAPQDDQSYLTSTPPRPPSGGVGIQSFSMKGDDKGKSESSGEKKFVFSKPIIIGLVAVFFVAWTFFWIVFFFQPF